MINMTLYSEIDKKANADAKKHVENFIKKLNAFFDPSFNLTEYANGLYELLRYDGFDDYKIKSGKCDKKLYAYISEGQLNPVFSEAYKNVFEFVFPKISKVYDTEIREARESNQTGSPFYKFFVSASDKRHMTTEIIANALQLGIDDKNIDEFIIDYINGVRIKEASISDKETRKAEREASIYRQTLSPEQIRRLIIAIIIAFGICWISKVSYEVNQNKEQPKTNKPEHSFSTSSPYDNDYYGSYNLDTSGFTKGR